jgi:hypothetical protein
MALALLVMLSSLAIGCAHHTQGPLECRIDYSTAEEAGRVADGIFLSHVTAHALGAIRIVSGNAGRAIPFARPPRVAFMDVRRVAIVPLPANEGLASPIALASREGDVHVFWGHAHSEADDDPFRPTTVEAVRHAVYADGAWSEVKTLISGSTLRWGWAQRTAARGSAWAIAAPIIAPQPGIFFSTYRDGMLHVRTIPLHPYRPVATATAVTDEGEVVLAALVGPPDDDGAMSVVLMWSRDGGSTFTSPELVPEVRSRGYAHFELIPGTGDRLHLIWAEFLGGPTELERLERVDLIDATWQRQPPFEPGVQIGSLHMAPDACGDLHVAFSTGRRLSRVLAGRWSGSRDELVDVTSGTQSSNPFFVLENDSLALYWFSFVQQAGTWQSSLWRAGPRNR